MRQRVKIDLPYVNIFEDRNGHVRAYFRRAGRRLPLPHPDSAEFLDAYKAARYGANTKPDAHPVPANRPGSFGGLCHDYMRSADFVDLAQSTRKEMTYVINALIAQHGDKPIKRLERRHILDWKDELAKKPGAANKMLRTVKQIMTFAEDRGHRPDNLAKGIKLMRCGRWRAWTDEELLAFEARWPIGTRERLGYALALYTGQRRGDLVRLTWASIAGDAFRLKQNKTKTNLVIPIMPPLQDVLAAVQPRRPAAILTGDRGNALNPVYFGHIMASAIEAARLPKDCVLHGLRKTTGRLIAEADGLVAPITGHRTERMTAEYSRDASQERLARASVLKWSNAAKSGSGT